MNCSLKDTCKGSDFCWCGECVLKNVFEAVTEKAPKETHANYRNILKAIAQGRNIFLTAPGGCGKSFFLNQLSSYLADKIILTATTGVAALGIRGTTLHSALGLGLGNKPVKNLLQGLNAYKLDFLNRIEILAIDEVSMLSGELLDKCNEFLKLARMDNRPFGGIQVILIGDFCQLPPVDDAEVKAPTRDFCFYSSTWKELNLVGFELTHNFRQQDDPQYAEVLRLLRLGDLTQEGYDLIKSREEEPEYLDGIPRLYATNKEVFDYNTTKLKSLGSEIKTFEATYKTLVPGIQKNQDYFDSLVAKMKKSSVTEDVLSLCEGARVMLTRNLDLDSGLVNGSLGYIEYICDDDSILVNFDNGESRFIKLAEVDMHDAEGKVILTQTQYPLKLAYSLTVHKSQGSTLEKVFIDFDHFFEVNQGYVALSRVKKSSGLYVKNFRTTALRFSPEVLAFYKGNKTNENSNWINSTQNTITCS